jgi:exopolyphosphatase/pppGpp-phosphohydrolase
MNLASIDLGTNSTRLLIAEICPVKDIPSCKGNAYHQIGQKHRIQRFIGSEGPKKTIDVLCRVYDSDKKNMMSSFKAVGTAALRAATNKRRISLKSKRDRS